MSILACQFQGRTGNQAMQWLFAKAYAERHEFTFQCDSWIGQRIFQIEDVRPHGVDGWPRYNEAQLATMVPNHSFAFRGYAQCQSAMLYSKRQARAWLKLRPDVETACANAVLASDTKDATIIIHQRRGDYHGYGYPTVSTRSYIRALDLFGLRSTTPHCAWLTEEDPIPHVGFLPDELAFAPDFYRMMTAPTLLRGNSSFSWLAALLGDGLVLSPIVDGLEGGKEHDTAFVAGNHPKFCNLDFVSDLYVAP